MPGAQAVCVGLGVGAADADTGEGEVVGEAELLPVGEPDGELLPVAVALEVAVALPLVVALLVADAELELLPVGEPDGELLPVGELDGELLPVAVALVLAVSLPLDVALPLADGEPDKELVTDELELPVDELVAVGDGELLTLAAADRVGVTDRPPVGETESEGEADDVVVAVTV